MANKEADEKQFSLKPVELNLIRAIQEQSNVTLSNTISFIALERLAYDVTEFTRFRVEDNNLYIKEDEPQEEVETA